MLRIVIYLPNDKRLKAKKKVFFYTVTPSVGKYRNDIERPITLQSKSQIVSCVTSVYIIHVRKRKHVREK